MHAAAGSSWPGPSLTFLFPGSCLNSFMTGCSGICNQTAVGILSWVLVRTWSFSAGLTLTRAPHSLPRPGSYTIEILESLSRLLPWGLSFAPGRAPWQDAYVQIQSLVALPRGLWDLGDPISTPGTTENSSGLAWPCCLALLSH